MAFEGRAASIFSIGRFSKYFAGEVKSRWISVLTSAGRLGALCDSVIPLLISVFDSNMVDKVHHGILVGFMGRFGQLPFGHYLLCHSFEVKGRYSLVLTEGFNRYLLGLKELHEEERGRFAGVNFVLFVHR